MPHLAPAVALFLFAFGQPATPGPSQCDAMPGLETATPLEGLDYLVVGETHGTRELPAAFADIVCAALASGRPVVVGIEQGPEHQAALDAYLASDGGPDAREALTSAPQWSIDTRFSRAMADLIETVRGWRAAGADVRLAAFDEIIDQPGTNDVREAGMARRLAEAQAVRPGTLVVALTGLGHADREGFVSMSPPVASMIMHLPADRSASLAFVRSGGESWRCTREGDGAEVCGPTALTVREPAAARGVHPVADEAFSARYSPGAPLTASPPARAGSTGH